MTPAQQAALMFGGAVPPPAPAAYPPGAAQMMFGGGIPAISPQQQAQMMFGGGGGGRPAVAQMSPQQAANIMFGGGMGGGPSAPAVPAGYGVYGTNPCGIKKRKGGGCYYPSVKNGGSASCLGVYRPGQQVPCPSGMGPQRKAKVVKAVPAIGAQQQAAIMFGGGGGVPSGYGAAGLHTYRGRQYKVVANNRCQNVRGGYIHCPPPTLHAWGKPVSQSACSPYGQRNCKRSGAQSVATIMKQTGQTKTAVLAANPNVYITRISKGSKDARAALNRQNVTYAGTSGSWLVFNTPQGQFKAQVTAKTMYI